MEKNKLKREEKELAKDEQDRQSTARERSPAPKENKLKTLKADAFTLKHSLRSYKKEVAKTTSKEVQNQDSLNELVAYSGVRMDPDVLEHMVELLKLDVDPDKLFYLFQILTTLEKESEMVSVI